MNIINTSYTYTQYQINVEAKKVKLELKNISGGEVTIERFEIKNFIPQDFTNGIEGFTFPFLFNYNINTSPNNQLGYTDNSNLIYYTDNYQNPIDTYQSYPYRSENQIVMQNNETFRFDILYAPILFSQPVDYAYLTITSGANAINILLKGKKLFNNSEIDTIDFDIDVTEINGINLFNVSSVS